MTGTAVKGALATAQRCCLREIMALRGASRANALISLASISPVGSAMSGIFLNNFNTLSHCIRGRSVAGCCGFGPCVEPRPSKPHRLAMNLAEPGRLGRREGGQRANGLHRNERLAE